MGFLSYVWNKKVYLERIIYSLTKNKVASLIGMLFATKVATKNNDIILSINCPCKSVNLSIKNFPEIP